MRYQLAFLPLLAVPALAAEAMATFDRSLNVTGSVQLEVRTDSGSISVLPGGSGQVRVHAKVQVHSSRLSQSTADSLVRQVSAAPPIVQNGSYIRLDEPSDEEARRHVNISWEVTVPPSTKVTANADSGSISIRGVDGPVTATADSGSVRVESVKADVTVNTDSGSIAVTDAGAAVSAQADSGSIRIATVAGPVDASTDSGSIRASMTTAKSARLRSDSGSVELDLPETGGYDVNLRTDSGGIQVDQISVTGTIRRDYISGKIRGGGVPVDVKTDSGSIRVR